MCTPQWLLNFFKYSHAACNSCFFFTWVLLKSFYFCVNKTLICEICVPSGSLNCSINGKWLVMCKTHVCVLLIQDFSKSKDISGEMYSYINTLGLSVSGANLHNDLACLNNWHCTFPWKETSTCKIKSEVTLFPWFIQTGNCMKNKQKLAIVNPTVSLKAIQNRIHSIVIYPALSCCENGLQMVFGSSSLSENTW